MKNILLIRHGQSEWNKLNLFTGFKNIELSEQGIEEANKAGQNFKNLDIKFNIVFTSELKRAQETAKIILQNLDQWDFLNNEGKIISNINLNERDYGDLTGLNKKETAEKFGEEQVHKWRRGYSDQPPNGESLEDVVRRVTKYFEEVIKPAIQSEDNSNILIIIVPRHPNRSDEVLSIAKMFLEKSCIESNSNLQTLGSIYYSRLE